MKEEADFGTDEKGCKSHEYCTFCYLDGAFTHPEITLEEQIEMNREVMTSQFGKKAGESRELMERMVPKLKRWQKEH